jgi:hypothetical protein
MTLYQRVTDRIAAVLDEEINHTANFVDEFPRDDGACELRVLARTDGHQWLRVVIWPELPDRRER